MDPVYEEPHVLMRELLGSLRDINWRLRELKWAVQKGLVAGEARKKVLAKIERTMQTKMCLIYSIYDIRQSFLKEVKSDKLRANFSLATLFQDLRNI